jgi:acyl-CoA synthetase (AMP-forming)/AMP-acid ligase II
MRRRSKPAGPMRVGPDQLRGDARHGERVAGALYELGVRPGQVVACLLPNCDGAAVIVNVVEDGFPSHLYLHIDSGPSRIVTEVTLSQMLNPERESSSWQRFLLTRHPRWVICSPPACC